MFFNSITGKEGTIKIVELGAVIGQFSSWRLSRERVPGADDKFTEFYTFRGECHYINPALFKDEDYDPVVFIVTQRNPKTKQVTQFRLDQDKGNRRSLDGRRLLMEGCRLVRE